MDGTKQLVGERKMMEMNNKYENDEMTGFYGVIRRTKNKREIAKTMMGSRKYGSYWIGAETDVFRMGETYSTQRNKAERMLRKYHVEIPVDVGRDIMFEVQANNLISNTCDLTVIFHEYHYEKMGCCISQISDIPMDICNDLYDALVNCLITKRFILGAVDFSIDNLTWGTRKLYKR